MAHNLSVQAGRSGGKKRSSLIYRPSFKFYYSLVKPRDCSGDFLCSFSYINDQRQGRLTQKLISHSLSSSFDALTSWSSARSVTFSTINSHRVTRQRRFNFDSSGKHFQHWHWRFRFSGCLFLCVFLFAHRALISLSPESLWLPKRKHF